MQEEETKVNDENVVAEESNLQAAPEVVADAQPEVVEPEVETPSTEEVAA